MQIIKTLFPLSYCSNSSRWINPSLFMSFLWMNRGTCLIRSALCFWRLANSTNSSWERRWSRLRSRSSKVMGFSQGIERFLPAEVQQSWKQQIRMQSVQLSPHVPVPQMQQASILKLWILETPAKTKGKVIMR